MIEEQGVVEEPEIEDKLHYWEGEAARLRTWCERLEDALSALYAIQPVDAHDDDEDRAVVLASVRALLAEGEE